jgi:hypothetical protein
VKLLTLLLFLSSTAAAQDTVFFGRKWVQKTVDGLTWVHNEYYAMFKNKLTSRGSFRYYLFEKTENSDTTLMHGKGTYTETEKAITIYPYTVNYKTTSGKAKIGGSTQRQFQMDTIVLRKVGDSLLYRDDWERQVIYRKQ